MIRNAISEDFSKVIRFLNIINLDVNYHSSYLSRDEERLKTDVLQAIEESHLLIYGDYEGIILYYKNDDLLCLDVSGPFSEKEVGLELIQHLRENEKGYKLNFFFTDESKFYHQLMMESKAFFKGNESILSLNKFDFNKYESNLEVQLVKSEDIEVVKKIHRETFKDVYLTEEMLVKQASNRFLFCLKDSKVVGYALVELRNEDASLEVFAIDSLFRGKGLAKGFLSEVIKYVFNNLNVSIVKLVVENINESAFSLYKKIGFTIEDKNAFYQLKEWN